METREEWGERNTEAVPAMWPHDPRTRPCSGRHIENDWPPVS